MTGGGLVAVVGVACLLAYVNGANDVGKGVATLVGSGTAEYRRALAWGTAWTAAGGLLGAMFAGAMLTTFGNGLLAPGTVTPFAAALAGLLGAGGWVLLATRSGLPVSTTHALVGSLVGVAAFAHGMDGVRWGTLGVKVLLPLLVSPIVSLVLTTALARASTRRSPATADADCLCAEIEPAALPAGSSAAVSVLQLHLETGSSTRCASERPAELQLTLGNLHWLTSGLTSLARGMNDAPKIVALAISASALGASAALPTPLLFLAVTGGIVTGSLVAGRRVTHVLAERITPMDHREGFAANLVTSALVGTGAIHGLPMSTTHVASGAIFGIGARRGSLDTRVLRDIVLAWIVTLPASALLGVGAYLATTTLGG